MRLPVMSGRRKRCRMENEMIVVLDFGGQYNQLIARRVRECNVYCEVHPYSISMERLKEMRPKGIIFTGGPNSVYGADSPLCRKEIFDMGIPILGICYGSQLICLEAKWLRLLLVNMAVQKWRWLRPKNCFTRFPNTLSAG